MKIINPSVEILTPIDGDAILEHIERCGRVCYKSEDKISKGTAQTFVKSIIQRGHESVLEHFNVTVKFIVDRGVSHEIVRHRIISVSQESTRYCNYSQGKFGNELTFIKPCFCKDRPNLYEGWEIAMHLLEITYLTMIDGGATPQEARSVLPNSLKTELVMTANLREWRHFLKLRTSQAAHPQMREVALMLLEQFRSLIPVVFDDINP